MPVLVLTAAMLIASAPMQPDSMKSAELTPWITPEQPEQKLPLSNPTSTVSEQATPSAPSPTNGVSDIVVTARPPSKSVDPLQTVNTASFNATQSVDTAFVGPVALAYKRRVPGPVRSGLRNALYNLREPDIFLNFLLQLKPGKAAETLGRFAINSIMGGAGLFDIAKRHPFNLPRRPNGFADTLGYYGVRSGAFLFLPLIGPTTVRDLIGDGLDRLVLPLAVGAPFNRPSFTIPVTILGAVDRRAEFDEQLNTLRADPANAYIASRTFYLQRRKAEIDGLKGRH